jgi:vancomycin resistance protein VanJ
VQKSVIQAPAGPVTIYNVHFLRTVLRRSHNWQRLHDEINDLVLNEILMTSGPVILGGDFNMTDQTQTYRDISKVLKNAHWEAGSGFGFTFPSTSRKIKRTFTLPPIVRIDHIFFNKYLHAYRARTLDESGGSDHLPIVSEFVLLNKP